MALKTTKVDVTVVLDVNNDPKFYFQTSQPMTGKDHLKFKKGKQDGFLINFNLQDPNNVYSFGRSLNEALYSQSQASCPTTSGQWDQFKAYAIVNGGMTLQVHNKNQTMQDFGYTLRVTRDAGANYLDLDPIGTNENSNLKISIPVATASTVIGATAGYLATQISMPTATTMAALTGAVIGAVVGFGLYYAFQGLGAQAA